MHYLVNEKENLVTISNSILKYFTNKTFNNTSKKLDEILYSNDYQKVCIILFDGLGKSLRNLHLSEKDFIRKKEEFVITSIFPPTTVAATTSLLSGLYPSQNSWLGWQQYFKQNDLVIEMFTNRNASNFSLLPPPNLANLYCPYTSILSLINEEKGCKAYSLTSKNIDKVNGAESLDGFFIKADSILKNEGKFFAYLYYPEPDSLIHKYGINSPLVKRNIKEINRKMAKLSKDNKDTLIILLADHSLIDSKFFYIYEHEDFKNCLSNITSLDCRSSFFHVKKGKEKEFEDLFNKYYGKYFKLYTRQEVIEKELFGPKPFHPLFEDFIGEYMATSISNYGFKNRIDYPLIGAHSGSVKEEFDISVSIINKK